MDARRDERRLLRVALSDHPLAVSAAVVAQIIRWVRGR
jgi:hypothetical protein